MCGHLLWTEKKDLYWSGYGGGFARGNGIEQDGYNGENIARAGDIVFCSINHRLGPFGFTDLSGFDDKKFGSSGNVRMLDIIAALKWVNENIENLAGILVILPLWGNGAADQKFVISRRCLRQKGWFIKVLS